MHLTTWSFLKKMASDYYHIIIECLKGLSKLNIFTSSVEVYVNLIVCLDFHNMCQGYVNLIKSLDCVSCYFT